jgi:single-strand DNA-binding protein
VSTHFYGEGNLGSAPEFREFPSEQDEPHRLLRLNVYFDNPIPVDDGFEDRGGYWAPVELWHRDAQRWSRLFQKGMRVLVEGRTVSDKWEDSEGKPQVTFKIEARRVAVLPYRIERITMAPKSSAPPDADSGVQD